MEEGVRRGTSVGDEVCDQRSVKRFLCEIRATMRSRGRHRNTKLVNKGLMDGPNKGVTPDATNGGTFDVIRGGV